MILRLFSTDGCSPHRGASPLRSGCAYCAYFWILRPWCTKGPAAPKCQTRPIGCFFWTTRLLARRSILPPFHQLWSKKMKRKCWRTRRKEILFRVSLEKEVLNSPVNLVNMFRSFSVLHACFSLAGCHNKESMWGTFARSATEKIR